MATTASPSALHFSSTAAAARRRAIQVRHWRFSGVALRTLVVIADTDVALALESLGPETAQLDVGLRHAHVGEQQPRSEDWLG